MTASEFVSSPNTDVLESGLISWASPSNIALIKYWGKYPDQIPANPSISFTLDACRTVTSLGYNRLDSPAENYDLKVIFDGEPKPEFEPKIRTFFKRIEQYLPFVKSYRFSIETRNTFPHSSGIASSASGMSALSLCLLSMEREMDPGMTDEEFYRKASFIARLGSGSASRSISGNLMVWGKHELLEDSSDLYAIRYTGPVHERFSNYHDTILLVDEGQKEVSSTVGHALMNDHPFAEQRFQQARTNLSKLIEILKTGDLNAFCQVVEEEALALHAMMMTSNPSYVLMKPETLAIIESIRSFRNKTGLHPCFTLDAGANVHLLFPESEASEIYDFIKNELVAYCQNEHYICDRIGFGAKQLPI